MRFDCIERTNYNTSVEIPEDCTTTRVATCRGDFCINGGRLWRTAIVTHVYWVVRLLWRIIIIILIQKPHWYRNPTTYYYSISSNTRDEAAASVVDVGAGIVPVLSPFRKKFRIDMFTLSPSNSNTQGARSLTVLFLLCRYTKRGSTGTGN